MRVIGAAMAGVALIAACSSPPPSRPDNREAAYRENNRGVAELEQYAYDKAVASFRRAITLDDRVALPYLNLAIALYYASSLEDGQRAVDAAESRFPNSPQVAFMRGLIARASNRPADAEAAFKRVLALDPDDAASMVNLGQIYLQDRKTTEAVAMLRTAVAREPSNASARYALGQALIRSGAREEGARETARFEALRDSGAGVTYSQTYLEQGHYAEALVSTGLEPDLVSRDVPSVRFTDQTASWVGPGPIAVSATSQGSFPVSPGASGNGRVTTVVLSDVDVDGDLDLLVGDRHGVTLFKWNGRGFSEETGARLLEPRAVNGIVIGDLDNDNRPDLVTVLEKGLSTRRQTASGAFEMFPRQAAVSINGETAAMLDADHDGDLDVLVGGQAASSGQSGLVLLRNDGQGRFSDMTATAKLSLVGRPLSVVPVDFDNRRDVDVLTIVDGRPARLFQNQRDGSFRDVAAEVGLLEIQGFSSLTSCDLNKDGFPDVVVASNSSRIRLALSDGRGRFGTRDGPESSKGISAVQCADYDNDGLLDVVGSGADGIRILRNVGTELADVTSNAVGEDARALRSIKAMALGDVDQDGDLDLAVASPAGVRLLRNDGGSARPSVRVALKGRVSNRSGVGARIDVRAGSLSQRLERLSVSPPAAPEAPTVGLGSHASADAVRVLWPAGILQAESDVKSNVATIVELDRKPSSCPFLYTWNGQSFEFITDFLGGGELGYWEGPGLYNHPDPDELVRITDTQLRPRDGRLELRVTNELEEVLYLDHVALLSVDHPSDVEIYPREGMRAAAARGLDLVAVRNVRPVSRAWSDRGENLTAQLATRDGSFATGFVPRSIRGYADPHDLMFELPASDDARRSQALLLTGWTDYAFSSDNVAASQRGWAMDPPRLEVRARNGAWRQLDGDVGIPVGRPQTLVVKIGDVARPGTQFRLRTNMRIHWDAVAIADIASDVSLATRAHSLTRADLRWRGFSAIDDSITPRPAIPDYQRVSASSPWKVFPGRYTREGDVQSLLAEPDDLFVVARTGDEIALAFDSGPRAAEQPRTPPALTLRQAQGHPERSRGVSELQTPRRVEGSPESRRTYLVAGIGFSKEMDMNSASPDVVLPLPARGLTHYPSLSSSKETRARQREMLDRYNTRVVARPVPSLTTRQP